MTSEEKLIQELRRKIASLEARNKELETTHMEDIAQLAYYRRQIDFLMDAAKEAEHDQGQR